MADEKVNRRDVLIRTGLVATSLVELAKSNPATAIEAARSGGQDRQREPAGERPGPLENQYVPQDVTLEPEDPITPAPGDPRLTTRKVKKGKGYTLQVTLTGNADEDISVGCARWMFFPNAAGKQVDFHKDFKLPVKKDAVETGKHRYVAPNTAGVLTVVCVGYNRSTGQCVAVCDEIEVVD